MAGITHAVIPQPLHHKPLDGCLSYPHGTPPRILHQHPAESAAAFLQAELQRLFAAPEPPSVGLLVDQGPDPLGVQLRVDPALAQVQHLRCKEEAYHLIATPQEGVTIVAAAPAGAFYGAVTLLQLLRKQGQQVELPCVEVSSGAACNQQHPPAQQSCSSPDLAVAVPHQVLDAPMFPWRGVLLDVGRHYFSVPFIKRVLDYMAAYKLNRFHWHLTEDQVGLEQRRG